MAHRAFPHASGWGSLGALRRQEPPVKVHIEIDCTPEELKDLLIPSDKEAEFAAKAYQAMVEAMQKAMVEQFRSFGRKD